MSNDPSWALPVIARQIAESLVADANALRRSSSGTIVGTYDVEDMQSWRGTSSVEENLRRAGKADDAATIRRRIDELSGAIQTIRNASPDSDFLDQAISNVKDKLRTLARKLRDVAREYELEEQSESPLISLAGMNKRVPKKRGRKPTYNSDTERKFVLDQRVSGMSMPEFSLERGVEVDDALAIQNRVITGVSKHMTLYRSAA